MGVQRQHLTIKAGLTRTAEHGRGATGVLLCPLPGSLRVWLVMMRLTFSPLPGITL